MRIAAAFEVDGAAPTTLSQYRMSTELVIAYTTMPSREDRTDFS